MAAIGHPYTGTVEDVKDPQGLGRLRVRVNEVHGDGVSPQWAWPSNGIMAGSNRGFFFIPRVGDLVRVEFLQGDISRPVWQSGNWTLPIGVAPLPTEFQGQAGLDPLRQGFATDRWVQVMDDNVVGELKLIDRTTGATIHMKNDGAIELKDADGASVLIDPTADKIEATTSAGVKLTLDALKAEIIDKAGQKFTMDGVSAMTLDPLATTGLINLMASASDFLVKGTTFLTLFNANAALYNGHTHGGAVAIPVTLMALMVAGTHTSLQVKTG